METFFFVVFTLIGFGLLLYLLFGLCWNFVICIAQVVYWVWYPIDRLLQHQRRYRPQRALDY